MIDIIVPTGVAWRHLELSIQAVERFTRNEFKLILVNNGSACKETRRILDAAKSRGHVVVELGLRVGFAASINAGLAMSKGEYVVFLNDDCYVSDGWDATMMAELQDRSVGMVGAYMPGGAAGAQGAPPLDTSYLRVPFLVFAHVMLRRDVIDAAGALDATTFDGFGSEDLDYCWRVREKGFKLKVSQAKSLHVGGSSMSASGGEAGRMDEYGRMHKKLEEKWGKGYVARESRLYPKIAVAIPTYDGKIQNDFFQSFVCLQKTGGFEIEVFQTKRIVIHWARENIAEAIVNGDGFDYVWWLDDDMTFPPDTLPRLLRHQQPIVCALAYQRREPYNACIFEWSKKVNRCKADEERKNGANGNGGNGANGAKDEFDGNFSFMNGQERTGLRKIDGCGSACVLVKLDVYRQIERPWYDNKHFGEDLHFCFRCRKKDIPIYCDTDLVIGHLGEPVIVDEVHVQRFRAWQAQQQQMPVFAR